MTAARQPTADCPRCGRALPVTYILDGDYPRPGVAFHTIEGDICRGVSPELRQVAAS